MGKRKINPCSNLFDLAKSLISNQIFIVWQTFSQTLGQLITWNMFITVLQYTRVKWDSQGTKKLVPFSKFLY